MINDIIFTSRLTVVVMTQVKIKTVNQIHSFRIHLQEGEDLYTLGSLAKISDNFRTMARWQ